MSIRAFWKPQPRSPGRDFRAWSLLIPSIASAVGFWAFAVLAFSFTEMSTLSEQFRINLVLLGAFSLAIGGEGGTLTATIEIFRKARNKETVWWDWVGICLSLLATLTEFLLAFAALLNIQDILDSTVWSLPIQIWGPLALGCLSALDSYVNFMEVGLYVATYDKRYTEWEVEYNAFLADQAEREQQRMDRWQEQEQTSTAQPVPEPAEISQYVEQIGEYYRAKCPACKWRSTSTYTSVARASAAAGGHRGKCSGVPDF